MNFVVQWMEMMVTGSNGEYEPCIVDGDGDGSTKGLAQSIPLKGKENNLDIIDDDYMANWRISNADTFPSDNILLTLDTNMVDARHMRLRPGKFLNS